MPRNITAGYSIQSCYCTEYRNYIQNVKESSRRRDFLHLLFWIGMFGLDRVGLDWVGMVCGKQAHLHIFFNHSR